MWFSTCATVLIAWGQPRNIPPNLEQQLQPNPPPGMYDAAPPFLVSSVGGRAVGTLTPLLKWQPSDPAPARGLYYQVTAKPLYRGQLFTDAMQNNPVRVQATVATTSYQITAQHQLDRDAADPNYAGHVWQV